MPDAGTRPIRSLPGLAAAVGRNIRQLRLNLAELDHDPGPDPIVPKGFMRAILRIAGRPIVCADCGRQIFVALPVVWRGQVMLIGATEHLVRVSFSSSERLEFRHAQLDECPSRDRPWVP